MQELREIDQRALDAAQDPDEMSAFIIELEPYILKCASKTAKRYIDRSDDEWAISIEAFYQAVQQYSYEKGSFLGFAKMIISRRLIDYFRSESKYRAEILVSPSAFTGESAEGEETLRIPAQSINERENVLKDEIEAANTQFASYGFSFYDLIRSSPKSKKTKDACNSVISYLASSAILICEMQRSKVLPLKMIEQNTGIPRKIMERHRKYIIAAVEIASGEYPGLSEYICLEKGGPRT